ncbi:MAG: hypothetical protein IPJ78_19180 [Gemmatimonadetes bacterium]|nr:hypothetical protein [Gemmatimonadota bacterium]
MISELGPTAMGRKVRSPADFLAQFANARAALQQVTTERTVQRGAHKSARAIMPVQLVRGRRAVERMDAIVRASYAREPGVLAAWRSAKRVQRAPGGARPRAEQGAPVPEPQVQQEAQPVTRAAA